MGHVVHICKHFPNACFMPRTRLIPEAWYRSGKTYGRSVQLSKEKGNKADTSQEIWEHTQERL